MGLQRRLAALPGLQPLPSAANYLLLRSTGAGAAESGGAAPGASLQPLRLALEQRHHILLRDCRSFAGLGEAWLRIGLQNRAGNRRIVSALARELSRVR
jgi:histidinol-phosphate/aromatic aminotransferase/cobyric acid decarboxylase-like protein